ncbi:MAG: FAD-linked oxidase C-terminal domain-containing protein, partial [Candidatus Margulisiibacteriota bacterium]|nr:FAD-linked oxidase C-terminal domain-containing protein [Candidatus Margulisiibacteriota bacterium]
KKFPVTITAVKEGQTINDEFEAKIKPYNAPLPPFKTPALFMQVGQIGTIKDIILLAKQTNSTIIPVGANTNLVQLCRFDESFNTNINLIIFLNYSRKDIEYDYKTKQFTCTPATTLSDIQNQLLMSQRRWDVDFSAKNATIGGILSTNAGGQYKKACESIEAYSILGSDLKVHTVKSHPHNTSSMFPIGSKHTLNASQGLCGIITNIRFNTEPRWQASYSAFIRVPVAQLNQFQQSLITLSDATLVACELMDSNCFNANPTPHIPTINEDEVLLLCQFASTEDQLNHNELWESICNQYPTISESIMLSSSKKQENDFWNYRHHISDNNRAWANQNELTYIGYDIDLPKKDISLLLPLIRSRLKDISASLFCFGHSMQSNDKFTLHVNIAFPNDSSLTQQHISNLLIKLLRNKDITFAAEHGGMGHKSIEDTIKIASKSELKQSLDVIRQTDPDDIFKRDIKNRLIQHLTK